MTRRRWIWVGIALGLVLSPVAWLAYRYAVGVRTTQRLDEFLQSDPTAADVTAFLERNDIPHSRDRRDGSILAGVPVQGIPFEGMKCYTICFDQHDRVASFTAEYQWLAP